MSKQQLYFIKNQPFSENDPSSWFDVIKKRLEVVPASNEGFNLSSMRKRFSIIERIEGAEDNAEVGFSESEFNDIKSVTGSNWQAFSKPVMEFLEFLENCKPTEANVEKNEESV